MYGLAPACRTNDMEQTLSKLESQTSVTRERLSSATEELDMQAAQVVGLQQEVVGLNKQLGAADEIRQKLEGQMAGGQQGSRAQCLALCLSSA
jgi:hypothetical protein